MSKSNQELGPFGKSFIGDFPTVGSLSLLSFSFLLSALLSLGNLIPFLILFILSSSLTVLFTYNFIEPHFNSKPIINEIGRMNKTSFSLESIKRRFISGSERPKEIISFKDAIRSFFKNWANFRGRASRSEYNWSILFTNLMLIPVNLFYSILIGIILLLPESNPVASFFALIIMLISFLLFAIFYLCLLIPSITILMRRLHDIGYSGWLYFLYILIYVVISVIFLQISYLVYVFISFILSIPLLMIMILPGDNMPNKYGSVPTNKLNDNQVNFSLSESWDFSGSNLSKIFSSNSTFQSKDSGNWIFSRKGPIIGEWGYESKARTGIFVISIYTFLFLIKEFGLISSVKLIEAFSIDRIDLFFEFSGIIIYLLMLLFLFFILVLENKFGYFRKLFVIPKPISIFLGTFVLFLDFIVLVTYGLITSLSGFDDEIFIDPNSDKNLLIMSLLFINLAIAAPIVEELFFRGYLLDKLRNQYSDFFSALVTSILFGIIHWSPYIDYLEGSLDFSRVGTTMFGGFLYACLRIKTGSIWPSIICHSLWNGTIFFLLFL